MTAAACCATISLMLLIIHYSSALKICSERHFLIILCHQVRSQVKSSLTAHRQLSSMLFFLSITPNLWDKRDRIWDLEQLLFIQECPQDFRMSGDPAEPLQQGVTTHLLSVQSQFRSLFIRIFNYSTETPSWPCVTTYCSPHTVGSEKWLCLYYSIYLTYIFTFYPHFNLGPL